MRSKIAGYDLGEQFYVMSREKGCWKDNDGIVLGEPSHHYRCENQSFLNAIEENDVIYIDKGGMAECIYQSKNRSLDIIATMHCNSNCVMCPIKEEARQIEEDAYLEWVKAFIAVLPDDIRYICITGGEPTLIRRELLDLFDMLMAKYRTSSFQLLTNGRSAANSDFCDELVAHIPRYTWIGIPLHAHEEKLHDRITQSAGSFRQTVKGIKNLIKHGNTIEIRVLVTKLNAQDMLDLAHFIEREMKGVACVTFMGIEAMGSAAKNIDDVWIPYSEAARCCEDAIDYLVGSGIDVMLYNFPLCTLNRKYWFLAKKSITPYKVRFYDDCQSCEVKEGCCGFFFSTLNVRRTVVRPVVDIND